MLVIDSIKNSLEYLYHNFVCGLGNNTRQLGQEDNIFDDLDIDHFNDFESTKQYIHQTIQTILDILLNPHTKNYFDIHNYYFQKSKYSLFYKSISILLFTAQNTKIKRNIILYIEFIKDNVLFEYRSNNIENKIKNSDTKNNNLIKDICDYLISEINSNQISYNENNLHFQINKLFKKYVSPENVVSKLVKKFNDEEIQRLHKMSFNEYKNYVYSKYKQFVNDTELFYTYYPQYSTKYNTIENIDIIFTQTLRKSIFNELDASQENFDKFLNNGIHVVFPQINPKDYTLRKTFKEEHYLDKIFNALTYRPFVS